MNPDTLTFAGHLKVTIYNVLNNKKIAFKIVSVLSLLLSVLSIQILFFIHLSLQGNNS